MAMDDPVPLGVNNATLPIHFLNVIRFHYPAVCIVNNSFFSAGAVREDKPGHDTTFRQYLSHPVVFHGLLGKRVFVGQHQDPFSAPRRSISFECCAGKSDGLTAACPEFYEPPLTKIVHRRNLADPVVCNVIKTLMTRR